MTSFIIRQPKWIRNYSVAVTTASLIFIVVFSVLFSSEILKINVYLTLTVLCALFLTTGVFGIVYYASDKFYFKDGVYCSKKIFKKTQRADVSDIAVVNVKPCDKKMSTASIEFIGKNGETLLSFSADGWIFKNNIFFASLKQNRIRLDNALVKPR